MLKRRLGDEDALFVELVKTYAAEEDPVVAGLVSGRDFVRRQGLGFRVQKCKQQFKHFCFSDVELPTMNIVITYTLLEEIFDAQVELLLLLALNSDPTVIPTRKDPMSTNRCSGHRER